MGQKNGTDKRGIVGYKRTNWNKELRKTVSCMEKPINKQNNGILSNALGVYDMTPTNKTKKESWSIYLSCSNVQM